MKKGVYVLGLTYFGMHDSCAVLLKDGKVIAAAEEERFSRIKFDRSFPKQSIKWCLKKANISIKDVAYAGYFWQPWKGLLNRAYYYFQTFPIFLKDTQRPAALLDQFKAKYVLKKETGFNGKFFYLNHHITHAASVFYASGFKKSAILSLDGTGEKTSCWLGFGENGKIIPYKTINWPHSIGQLYRTVTQYLGFNIFSDEYKVMGLAPYGKTKYLDKFKKIAKLKPSGKFEINLSYIEYQHGKEIMYSDQWVKAFGPARKKGEPIEERHKNIAASAQARTEESIEHLAKYLLKTGDYDSLCLTGGVALNSVAIGKLARSGLTKKIYTSPVSGDAGCAFGAAYYIYHHILGNLNLEPLPHAYWGRNFTNEEIKKIIIKNKLPYTKHKNPQETAAQLIASGHVIGWFQGHSEVGQRALGNRSILADPRDPKMKDKVNRLIKYREPFRPFAPAILEEFQNDFFDYANPVPYMTEVHPVKKDKRSKIPSVVHIDGSGRIQTVIKKTNPKFWNLINTFNKITGIPVVLNTSFNVQGEPIVDSPKDAIKTFLGSGLDDIFLGNYWIQKKLL
ncbi:MAG TPA: carbamoyltransferase C-terminal domain-containing protein [Patescibacteria group bacterium]